MSIGLDRISIIDNLRPINIDRTTIMQFHGAMFVKDLHRLKKIKKRIYFRPEKLFIFVAGKGNDIWSVIKYFVVEIRKTEAAAAHHPA